MVVITGASGFIGQNMLAYLMRFGFNCLPVSRSNSHGYSTINTSWIDDNNIETIIHLAGLAHDLSGKQNEKKYYEINTDLTCKLFDAFLASKARVFIFMSSIKALTDQSDQLLIEEMVPAPISVYGKSKLAAENYLLNHKSLGDKRVVILRPAMVYGSGNKGNLNLLYQIISKRIPWPLGAFNNQRSFCSVENLCFTVEEIIQNKAIESGIYHIADDMSISTNEIVEIIGEVLGIRPHVWMLPKGVIRFVAKLGDIIKFPLNTDRLNKLTSSYRVSNNKISVAIGKPMPVKIRDGLFQTLSSFK